MFQRLKRWLICTDGEPRRSFPSLKSKMLSFFFLKLRVKVVHSREGLRFVFKNLHLPPLISMMFHFLGCFTCSSKHWSVWKDCSVSLGPSFWLKKWSSLIRQENVKFGSMNKWNWTNLKQIDSMKVSFWFRCFGCSRLKLLNQNRVLPFMRESRFVSHFFLYLSIWSPLWRNKKSKCWHTSKYKRHRMVRQVWRKRRRKWTWIWHCQKSQTFWWIWNLARARKTAWPVPRKTSLVRWNLSHQGFIFQNPRWKFLGIQLQNLRKI